MPREAPFIVFSLPRSRSKWLSVWLAAQGARVGHDLGIECGSVGDFLARLGALEGTCETGAMFGWRLLRAMLPRARFITIHRPKAEVLASLARFGLRGLEEEIERREAMLQVIAQQPGTMSFHYDELDELEACQRLWIQTIGPGFCPEQWLEYDRCNVQVDMPRHLWKIAQNAPGIAALKAEVLAMQLALPGGAPCGNLQ